MERAEILGRVPRIISASDRAEFFDRGFLRIERFASGERLSRLQTACQELWDLSRELGASNEYFELGVGHSAEDPRPVVLKKAADLHPAIWSYVSRSTLADVAVDLVGPNVKFRETYINFKAARIGEAVSWHQDFPFFPTTNRAMVTVLTYLEDVTEDMGPIRMMPGSHRNKLFDHYDDRGRWIGRISDEDLGSLSLSEAVSLPGPAGTIVVFDSCVIHGSEANVSARPRPVMVTGYAAADAFPYTATPPSMRSPRTWRIVRGRDASLAHLEAIEVRVPPDWRHQAYVRPDWPERDRVDG